MQCSEPDSINARFRQTSVLNVVIVSLVSGWIFYKSQLISNGVMSSNKCYNVQFIQRLFITMANTASALESMLTFANNDIFSNGVPTLRTPSISPKP